MRIEGHWIDLFARVFRRCGVQPGDPCAVLSQTQTRPELPQLCELALVQIGARPFHVVLPGRPLTAPAPDRPPQPRPRPARSPPSAAVPKE